LSALRAAAERFACASAFFTICNNAKASACDGLFLGGCLPRSRRHLLLL
jgi:hypothetical protein